MKHAPTEPILDNIRYFRGMAAEYLKTYRKTRSELELFLYRKMVHYLEGMVSTVSMYEGIAPKEVVKLAKNQRS